MADKPYIAKERLFVTEDRSRVVPESDSAARFLLAGEGAEIPAEVAAQYGLTNDKPAEKPEPEAPTEAKAVAGPPHTKAVTAPKAAK